MMQRIAMAVVVGSVISLAGCQYFKKDMEPDQTARLDYGALQPELYATSPPVGTVSPPIVSEPVATAADYRAYDQPAQTFEMPETASSQTTHIVARGDTLYPLARQYYDDQRRLRTIYDANRGTLSSPHKLYVGQELMIP